LLWKHTTGVNFTNIIGTKLEQHLRRKFLIHLSATAFSKNAPKMELGTKAVA
jgi:hypothetical protein